MPRAKAPTGTEVQDKAKAAKLDHGQAAEGSKGGKKSKFIPARLDHLKKKSDLEDGQVVGRVETEIEGDRSGLPPGTYNIFLANVEGSWKVYAEAGGEIVAEAASVQEREDTPENMPPKFRSGSFCWWVWLIFTGFEWCF